MQEIVSRENQSNPNKYYEAKYNDRDVIDDFLGKMFTSDYKTFEALQTIETYDALKNAIYRCTSIEQIDRQFEHNLDSFLDEMCKTTDYIVDTSQRNETLGNTLGELSLAYFKYMTEHETERCIFLIDQPEDHISNNNISQKLLRYFNSIRTKKQIIMVTHNPLLVVNQDVDQVLFVRKNGDKINVVSGCLEYEDDTYSEEKKNYPSIGQIIEKEGKKGKVISVDIFRHSYKIETKDKDVIEIFQDESN